MVPQGDSTTDPYPDVAPAAGTGDLVQCGNCGRYGWHTTDRCLEGTTDPQPDVAPPPGADWVDDWEPDPAHRVVFGVDRTVTDHTARVYASAIQLADGSVDQGLIEGPSVYVAFGKSTGLGPLNSDQTRELAAVLLETVAEIDRWAQR